MKRHFRTFEELQAAVGEPLGPSNWLSISQTRIHQFAEATGDHQWIHTNPERAATDSPYGQTIAHGHLTLSLIPMMVTEIFRFEPARLQINYGLNRVRFPAPVLEGSRIRMHATLLDAGEVDRGVQITLDLHFECESQPRPVCVAQAIYLFPVTRA
jgi:acyl dehydratase